MSKERLEEIKDILNSPGEVFFGSISEDGIVSQDVADAEPYFKWLIEQAERAEGLEKRNMNDYANGFVSGIEMFKLFLTDECETTGYATNEQINNALHRSVNKMAKLYEQETGVELIVEWGESND